MSKGHVPGFDPALRRSLHRLVIVALVAGAVSVWAPGTADHAHAHGDPGLAHAFGHFVGVGLAAWEATYAFARWVTYSAVLLGAGGALFLAAIHDRLPSERRLLAGVVTGAAVVGALGTIVGVVLHAGEVTGLGPGAIRDPTLLLGLLDSPDGTSALVRVAALAVLLAAVPTALRGRGDAVLLTGGAVAVLSFAMAGHTLTAEPGWLVFFADACHTLAASLWFGGLVLLGIVLHVRQRSGDPIDGATMVARFSAWATGSLLVVVAAGLILAWTEVRTLGALVATPYGWVLALKGGFVGGVVAVGAYNNRVLVPAITRAAPEDRGRAWRRLRWTVRVEVVGMAAALAATAVLVDQPPPRPHLEGSAGHPGMVEITDFQSVGEAPP